MHVKALLDVDMVAMESSDKVTLMLDLTVAPEDAINLIRTHRGPDALFNRNFANWLIEDALHFLGMSPSQQVA